MVGARCTCLATSTSALLRPRDCTGLSAKEQLVFAQRNDLPLLTVGHTENKVFRGIRVHATRSIGFSEKFGDGQCNAGFTESTPEDGPSTSPGQLTGGKDSLDGWPPCFRRGILAGSLAAALCSATGRSEGLDKLSSSSIPPFSANGNPASTSSTTDSWYRYKGRGFVVKVPPDFEDLQEPEDVPEDDESPYSQRAKEKPFAARFGSVDRKEVLSIVVRPVSQFKLAFLEAQDITALGTLQDAAKIFVPVGARIIGARSLISEESQGTRTYYLYEFATQDKRVALVAGAAAGQLYVAGAMAPLDRWRTSAAKLRSAALSFTLR